MRGERESAREVASCSVPQRPATASYRPGSRATSAELPASDGEHILTRMPAPSAWWHSAPAKGLASLAIALAVTFMPMVINVVRARARAPAVEIVASPGDIADSLRTLACDSAATDSSKACRPAAGR